LPRMSLKMNVARGGRSQIALQQTRPRGRKGRGRLRGATEHGDFVAALPEQWHEGMADEASPAEDEGSHFLDSLRLRLPERQ
jgi:hypothetical protein